jgi:hypothetical protein
MASCQSHGITFSNLTQMGVCLWSIQSSESGLIKFSVDHSGINLCSVEKLSQDINGHSVIPHTSPIAVAFNKLKG